MSPHASPMSQDEKIAFDKFAAARKLATYRDGRRVDAEIWSLFLADVLPVAHRFVLQNPEIAALSRAGVECLIGQLGLSPEVLVIATAVLRPQRLAVITTPASKVPYADLSDIVSKEPLSGHLLAFTKRQVEIAEHENERYDTLEIYQVIEKELKRAENPEAVVILIAGGTGEMAAATSAGAFARNLRTLYLEGQTGAGAASPDTQVMRFVPNPLTVFGGIDRAKADAAFTRGHYEEASVAYERLSNAIRNSEDAMMAFMCKLYQRVQDYNSIGPFEEAPSLMSSALGEHVRRMQAALKTFSSRNRVSSAAWLATTAERHLNRGQYFLSSAIAYRALEAICQLQCGAVPEWKWPARVSAAYVRERHPELYAAALLRKRLELGWQRVSFGNELGLSDLWTFLREVGDAIGRLYDAKEVARITRARNDGLLGHAWKSPSKTECEELLNRGVWKAAALLREPLARGFGEGKLAFTLLEPQAIRKLQSGS